MSPRQPLSEEENARLNGTPEEFPHREEAKAEYRALWLAFLSGDSEEIFIGKVPSQEARSRMDALQPLISHGPGSVWREFADSLPGYNEFWGATLSRGTNAALNTLPQG
jgi:hypothetical protein